MAGRTTTYDNNVANYIFGTQAAFAPATLFIMLFNVVPTNDGASGTEVSGTNYARVQWNPNAVAGTPAAPRWTITNNQIVNAQNIDFPATGTAGGTWTQANGFGIVTAASGGTLVYYGTFATARTAQTGDILRLPATTGIVINED